MGKCSKGLKGLAADEKTMGCKALSDSRHGHIASI
jgi:hypothetical protein